jgi:antitoxin (DNA-binding transcriptional repressor) of toxin-antitoxin stability system
MSQSPSPELPHELPPPEGDVTIYYAKTHLSRLLREVATGAAYVISRGDTPVARLVPYHRALPQRTFGALRERLVVPDAFLEPLPAAELDAWGGG